MDCDTPTALQLCRFLPTLEQRLDQRVDCVRWSEMSEGEQLQWLAFHGSKVRIVITNGHVGCPSDLMCALPNLGLVTINGVGFDKVDLALAAERGVQVSNTPDVLTQDVADLAVGLIIALKRGLPAADAQVRKGAWSRDDLPFGRRVSGSRFGILGMGRIGHAIAERLAPFGEIAYTARTAKGNDWRYFDVLRGLADWCDVLVVACPANASTVGLVDAEVLSALGKDGCLVNVARGSIVDEPALIRALEEATIAGAALDVFASEPAVPLNLRSSERTVLTPHIASATVETREAMARLVLANIDAFLARKRLPSPVCEY